MTTYDVRYNKISLVWNLSLIFVTMVQISLAVGAVDHGLGI